MTDQSIPLPRITHDQRWLWFGIIAAVIMGVMIGMFGLYGAAAVILVVALMALFFWPSLGYVAVISTIILGQLVRLPVPGSADQFFLLNDLFIPALVAAWLLRRLGTGSLKFPRTALWLPIIAVIGSMLASVFINRGLYSQSELIGGSLYIVRWIEYLTLFFITADYARRRQIAYKIVVGVVVTGVITALLGFIQLKLFPDFSFMAPKGWDPHIGRLLSTWFDPNFLGGYLAALVAITLALALKLGRRGGWWWVATIIMTLAVVLTYSRSGYLALATGCGIVTLFRSRAILYLGGLALIATIVFVPRVQERVIGIRSVDETAQLRIVSWENAARIIEEHPFIGVGYNFYREAQVSDGLLKDPTAHSATGSDSSLLLVAATMGIVGLAAYLWLLVTIAWETIKTMNTKSLSPEWRTIAFGTLAAFAALLVHSQFVNGLFFPHLMEFIWIMTGAVVAVRQTEAA